MKSSSFNDWLRKQRGGGSNSQDNEMQPIHPPYWEDTHDEHGNYTGDNRGIAHKANPHAFQPQAQPQAPSSSQSQNDTGQEKERFGNIAVYRPKSLTDVERFITFLRDRQPAVANLNDIDENDAQRILDYLSGAIFALGGSVHKITDNIFVFSPKGTQIHS